MARFDFPIPFGWYNICRANDMNPGTLSEKRVFGENLLLWRGEDGAYHLQENYCPHLGANIGADGKVVGNAVECPFHGWRFGGNGNLVEIPYAPDAKTQACLRNYPIREYYGLIVAWYHPDEAEPLFELPEIPELDDPGIRGPLEYGTHEVATCLQEMTENGVDGAHFMSIHKHPGPASFDAVEFDGFFMVSRTRQMFPSSKGPVSGTLDSYAFGMGTGVVRYKTLIEITMLTTAMPIDREHSVQRFQVFYKNPEGDPKIDRIAEAFNKEVNRQVEEDIPIWNKKIYRERPILTEGEAPITRFRRWAKQFYVEVNAAA